MKRYSSSIVLIVCLAALTCGFIELLALRFESGDVYPEYSSLRADPLGTMALYESIGKLEGFTATRDLSANGDLPYPAGVTYLHIATTDHAWENVPPDTLKKVEQFVNLGARLVITMYPEASRKPPTAESEKLREEARKKAQQEPRDKTVSLWDKWGLTPRVVNLRLGDKEVFTPVPVSNNSDLKLPETLEWHSGLVFEKVNPAWKPIYKRGNYPVLLERRFGTGSVVIATDSYFLSNEAMQSARHADLLAWMIGPNRTIVFDEAHLGIVDQPGIAALMRRYRLHWVIGSLALLTGLFVWKNSTSLVPARTADSTDAFIAGRDATSGFVNLLRRNIPAREVLATCYMEWKKTAAQSGSYSAVRLQQAEAVFNAENSRTAKERNPVETYRTIAGILHKRKK